MDFRNAKELLKVCQEQGLSISAVMLQRELTEGEQDPEETDRKMDRVLEIMKSAASTPIHTPVKSMGGLIGGEAKKISDHKDTGKVFAEIFWKELSFTRWQLWKPMLPWV